MTNHHHLLFRNNAERNLKRIPTRLGKKTDSKRDTGENGWKHNQTVNWAGNETALVKKFVEKKKLEMQRILFFFWQNFTISG